MPRVTFTQNLKRHVDCPEVLARVFAEHTRLRDYVLDEQGELRKHMIVFLNGEPLRDRQRLTDAVKSTDEIVVMQALSGG